MTEQEEKPFEYPEVDPGLKKDGTPQKMGAIHLSKKAANLLRTADENNSKYVQFVMELYAIADEDGDRYDRSVPALQKRFVRYLETCNKHGMKMGNQAAYLAMGVDQQWVYSVMHNKDGMGNNRERVEFLRQVKQICAVSREGMMGDGSLNPVVGIFWQKNFDGMKDQVDVAAITEKKDTASDIARRYADVFDITVKEEPEGNQREEVFLPLKPVYKEPSRLRQEEMRAKQRKKLEKRKKHAAYMRKKRAADREALLKQKLAEKKKAED